MNVQELINKLLKGITDGSIDGTANVYVQHPYDPKLIVDASKVAVEKVGHISRRIIIKP
jgi:hypothetical protein